MNLSTTIICLTAFVFQLGASPCGCLRENFWHQASVAIICNAQVSNADEISRIDGESGLHDHDAADVLFHRSGVRGCPFNHHRESISDQQRNELLPEQSDEEQDCHCFDLVYANVIQNKTPNGNKIWRIGFIESRTFEIKTFQNQLGGCECCRLKILTAPARAVLGVFQL